MKLSKNFELRELTRSATAAPLGIVNEPDTEQIENITALVTEVLQPVREMYNAPLRINSGYRFPELNKAVGGVPTSQHTKGEAADVHVADPRRMFNMIKRSKLPFDQIILYPTFVHISHKRDGENRRNILFAKGVQP
jgi:uncharacterized protein YcbK (DUF882 family)